MPYEYSRVSVPELVRDSRFLEKILNVEVVAFSRVTRRECYGRQKPWRKLNECGENSCHTDPVPKRDVRAYAKLARKMHGAGLADYSLLCVR